MDEVKKLELLAPARNGDAGITAINYGADAVYIGAPSFSARAAAGSSVGEIGKLIRYAHRYHARVYAALNTILFDNELEEARRMIYQLVDAGIDALIIQDMAIMEMDIPPVALHASTQVNNFLPENIRFLEKAGFTRVVLARELTLRQIAGIRQQTEVGLEAFVHGALCVSMSGQCYLSLAAGNRSGNRGVCAQPCRKAWNLIDAAGKVVVRNKHLLSLKDLDLSDYLPELARAGITSFKIEGRLKDENYVKNITALYRGKLDAFLEGNREFLRGSSGRVFFDFEPDPARSFSRGGSSYFLYGRHKGIVSFDTPKSAGERVATVRKSGGLQAWVDAEKPLSNNDGIAYYDQEGILKGLKVNTAEGNLIKWAEPVELPQGTILYRNYDHAFVTLLKNSRTCRKIGMKLQVEPSSAGIRLTGTDEDGITCFREFPAEHMPARDGRKAETVMREQLSKSGDTLFGITVVEFNWEYPLFLPVSVINGIRREFLSFFEDFRAGCLPRLVPGIRDPEAMYPLTELTWLGNVSNGLARQFYQKHGVTHVEPALEIARDFRGRRLMTMKHCLKYQMGFCPAENPGSSPPWEEPLFLADENKKYRIEFDCRECRMNLIESLC